MMWAEEELGGADLGDMRLKQRRVLLPDRPWGSSLLQESPRPVDVWRKCMPGICDRPGDGHRGSDAPRTRPGWFARNDRSPGKGAPKLSAALAASPVLGEVQFQMASRRGRDARQTSATQTQGQSGPAPDRYARRLHRMQGGWRAAILGFQNIPTRMPEKSCMNWICANLFCNFYAN